MVEVRWMKSALLDLKEIIHYISRDSVYYAELFKERIFEMVGHLESFPYLGRQVPEYKDENTREILYKSYRIIYRVINEDLIEVLAIHHGKRLLK